MVAKKPQYRGGIEKRYLWNFKKVVGKFVFFYKVQYILGVVMAWKTHII
jgi:hypothetical protein